MPEEGIEDSTRRATDQDPSAHASAGTSGPLILAVVLIAFGTIALLRSIDISVPSWRLVLAVALGLIGLGLIAQARRGLNGGLVALGVGASVILAAAGGLSVGIQIDAGHAFSEHTESPRSAAALEDGYSTAFGSLTLDLRELDLTTLPPGTTHIDVNAAFGSIQILPGDAPVRVEATSVFGSGEDYESPDYDRAEQRILINASTAFGSSEVRR
ncbi:MAG: LiaF-related protein [Chloroflexi bacterium]|nr:LiaF-related protein [Chloroflexota bacterium]MDA1147454.1 LiaF-related protein [Chloroflexota bacterium]